MKKYLVIGNPIGHSLSPLIHNHWMKKYRLFDSIYEKRKVEEKDLKDVVKEIRDDKIVGVNVTVPFKKLIIPFLDKLDIIATKTESVNTLLKVKNKIVGYNTDEPGFDLTVRELFQKTEDNMTSTTLQGKNIFVSGHHYANVASIIALRSIRNIKLFVVERTDIEELRTYYSFFKYFTYKLHLYDQYYKLNYFIFKFFHSYLLAMEN